MNKSLFVASVALLIAGRSFAEGIPPPAPLAVVDAVVRDAAGAPVEGALVAINPADPHGPPVPDAHPLAALRSDANGHVHAELAAQPIALTATYPGAIPALLLKQRAQAGTPLSVELKLGGPGVLRTFVCTSPEGLPLNHLEVLVTRVSPDIGDAFLPAINGAQGSITVDPAWRLSVVAKADGLSTFGVPLSAEGETQVALEAPVHDEQAPPAEVIGWMKEHALALSAAPPEHAEDDLKALAAAVGDARVVGLGDATPGSREFLELKNRLFEVLVREKGFTLLAIQADDITARVLDRYVAGGAGEPAAIAASLGRSLDTKEMLALLGWMRAWNAEPAHRKLRIAGLEESGADALAEELVDWLSGIDPQAAAAAVEKLRTLLLNKLDEASKQSLTSSLAELRALFDQHQQDWTARTSPSSWKEARHLLAMIDAMSGESILGRTPLSSEAIAARRQQRLQWFLEEMEPGAKSVLFSYSSAIAVPGDRPSAFGSGLRSAYGAGYLSIGFAFGSGSFMANHDLPHGEWLWKSASAPAPTPGSFDGAMAAAGIPLFALDFRAAPREGPVAAWLKHRHGMKVIVPGTDYTPETLPKTYWSRRLPGDFDLLVFAAELHPATRTATTPWASSRMMIGQLGPKNLDFSEGEAGKFPPAWSMSTLDARAGWRARTGKEAECGPGQSRCAVIEREPSHLREGEVAELSQHFEAEFYRGHTLRLRGSVSNALAGLADTATIAFAANSDKAVRDDRSLKIETTLEHNVWTPIDLTIRVPENATWVRIVLFASSLGGGAVRFGPMTVTMADDAPPGEAATTAPASH